MNELNSNSTECKSVKSYKTTTYIPVHEQINHSDIKGRRTLIFWSLVFLLFVLAVGNLIITIIIVNVLRIGRGLESLELISEANSIKFIGNTDLSHVYKRDGKIEGFHQHPINVLAENGSILINLGQRYPRPLNKLKLERNFTFVKNTEEFQVKNKQDQLIYSTNSPIFHNLDANTLNSKVVQVNRISSNVGSQLRLEGRLVSLKGSEGSKIEGKQLLWRSDQDIYLKTNGAISLNGEGIYINVERIPIVITKHYSQTNHYKVCVCMPQGKLFRVPVLASTNSSAHCNINTINHPCM